MKLKSLLITVTFVLGILLAVFATKFYQESNIEGYNLVNYPVQIVLPEGYKEITPESNLVGYYNKRQNKLYISFYDKSIKTVGHTNKTGRDTNDR